MFFRFAVRGDRSRRYFEARHVDTGEVRLVTLVEGGILTFCEGSRTYEYVLRMRQDPLAAIAQAWWWLGDVVEVTKTATRRLAGSL